MALFLQLHPYVHDGSEDGIACVSGPATSVGSQLFASVVKIATATTAAATNQSSE